MGRTRTAVDTLCARDGAHYCEDYLFYQGVLPMDHAKAVAYRIVLGGCLLCWAVVGAIIVVFTLT